MSLDGLVWPASRRSDPARELRFQIAALRSRVSAWWPELSNRGAAASRVSLRPMSEKHRTPYRTARGHSALPKSREEIVQRLLGPTEPRMYERNIGEWKQEVVLPRDELSASDVRRYGLTATSSELRQGGRILAHSTPISWEAFADLVFLYRLIQENISIVSTPRDYTDIHAGRGNTSIERSLRKRTVVFLDEWYKCLGVNHGGASAAATAVRPRARTARRAKTLVDPPALAARVYSLIEDAESSLEDALTLLDQSARGDELAASRKWPAIRKRLFNGTRVEELPQLRVARQRPDRRGALIWFARRILDPGIARNPGKLADALVAIAAFADNQSVLSEEKDRWVSSVTHALRR